MENTKEEVDIVSSPIYPENCHEWIQEMSGYHATVVKEILPYITDFIHLLMGEGAVNYYSKSQNKVVDISEIRDIETFLKGESYGAK